MNDWEQFFHDVPWFLRRGQWVVSRRGAGVDSRLDRRLAGVVCAARFDDAYARLGGWRGLRVADMGTTGRATRMALSPAPGRERRSRDRLQQSFWNLCGGIVERFCEPDTWWNNQNQVLTVDAARVGVADILADFAWLWKQDGLELPIDPGDYYAIAVEANGNLTLAHRDNSRLLLFAPDHAFTAVTPLAGCPPDSLLTIDDVPRLVDMDRGECRGLARLVGRQASAAVEQQAGLRQRRGGPWRQ
jgi:hypothetical protein